MQQIDATQAEEQTRFNYLNTRDQRSNYEKEVGGRLQISCILH